MTLTDRDIDELFAGRVPEGRDDLEDLTGFFDQLEGAFAGVSAAPLEEAHMAAMRAEAAPAEQPAVVTALAPRRTALRARAIAVVAATMFAFSGMALAGVLPGPGSGASARVADEIGILVPGLLEGALKEGRPGDGEQGADDLTEDPSGTRPGDDSDRGSGEREQRPGEDRELPKGKDPEDDDIEVREDDEPDDDPDTDTGGSTGGNTGGNTGGGASEPETHETEPETVDEPETQGTKGDRDRPGNSVVVPEVDDEDLTGDVEEETNGD